MTHLFSFSNNKGRIYCSMDIIGIARTVMFRLLLDNLEAFALWGVSASMMYAKIHSNDWQISYWLCLSPSFISSYDIYLLCLYLFKRFFAVWIVSMFNFHQVLFNHSKIMMFILTKFLFMDRKALSAVSQYRNRISTETQGFGVSKRESHDSSRF